MPKQTGSHPVRLLIIILSREMSEISTSIILFVGMITVALVSAADDPQTTYLGSGCSESLNRTYRNVTVFNNNQAAVFQSLASNLSSNGGSYFATSVVGNGTTDPVFGLAQCREYLTTNECLECFTAAKAKVKEVCPKSNGAKLYLDGCFLRFENNTSLYNEAEDGGSAENCSLITEPVEYSNTAHNLLIRLIENASTNGGYAVGSSNSIYAVVQCVKSLDNDKCQECLGDGRQRLTTNCLLNREVHALMAGCFIRYAKYPFFSDNQTLSPGNESRSDENESRSDSNTRVAVLVGSIGGGGLFVALCVAVVCRYYQCCQKFKGFTPLFSKAPGTLKLHYSQPWLREKKSESENYTLIYKYLDF